MDQIRKDDQANKLEIKLNLIKQDLESVTNHVHLAKVEGKKLESDCKQLKIDCSNCELRN